MSEGVLGFLGGTFDPLHVGHLRLALEAREALGLADVCLIPAGNPPLRDAACGDIDEILLSGLPLLPVDRVARCISETFKLAERFCQHLGIIGLADDLAAPLVSF